MKIPWLQMINHCIMEKEKNAISTKKKKGPDPNKVKKIVKVLKENPQGL